MPGQERDLESLRADLQGSTVMAEMQFDALLKSIDLEINPAACHLPSKETVEALQRIEQKVRELHDYWRAEVERVGLPR